MHGSTTQVPLSNVLLRDTPQGGILTALSHKRLLHTASVVPRSRQPDTLTQINLWFVAQLTTRLLYAVLCVAAKEHRGEPGHERPGMGELAKFLGHKGTIVRRPIGQVQGRAV